MSRFEFENIMVYPTQSFVRSTLVIFVQISPRYCGQVGTVKGILKKTPPQKVGYIKPITLPPTRTDVVRETMIQSQKISVECWVTYDLAIAKVAKQIQCEEQPFFDSIFVMFGGFHVEQNVYSSIGRIIEGSGGPYILSESSAIATGSLPKFLKGKMHYRCRHIHTLLSVAFHGLHMQQFILETFENSYQEIMNALEEWNHLKQLEIKNATLLKFIDQYKIFKDKTLAGKKGKTAQFWMQYCKIVDLYLLLHHSIKSNDVDMSCYTFFELCPITFATKHQNYARWMTYYALELVNLKIEKPEVMEDLLKGAFSISRSGNAFAGVPVDMALEQSINAQAKNRLNGIC